MAYLIAAVQQRGLTEVLGVPDHFFLMKSSEFGTTADPLGYDLSDGKVIYGQFYVRGS